MCIVYCQGISSDFKYVVINEYQCTCATDVSSDIQEIILSSEEAISPSKCSMSSSKTMIGNVANNAAALYNIQYERQYHSSKLAPSTCRVYEHELFYSLYGVNKFPLQANVGKPILRVNCNYEQSNICLKPLLHAELDASSFTSIPNDNLYGNKDKTASKAKLKDANNLAYLQTCNGVESSKGNTMAILGLLIVKKEINNILRYFFNSQT